MTCVRDYELEPYIYERFIEREKCTCTNSNQEKKLIFFILSSSIQCDKCLHYMYEI